MESQELEYKSSQDYASDYKKLEKWLRKSPKKRELLSYTELKGETFLLQTTRSYVEWVLCVINLVFLHLNAGESSAKASIRKGAKRGNRKYAQIVRARLQPFFDIAKELNPCYNYKDRSKPVQRTRWVYFTGTIPREWVLEEAWRKQMPYWYNLFITRLRRKYGKVYVIRTWEAHEDGYPHVHCILYFADHEFNAFFHKSGTWRIREYMDIRKYWGTVYDFKLKEYFPAAGNNGKLWISDVKAMDSMVGGLKYLAKYVSKSCRYLGTKPAKELTVDDLTPELLTLSLQWLYHKRSFSVSREFTVALFKGKGISTGLVGFAKFWAWNVHGITVLWGFIHGGLPDDWYRGRVSPVSVAKNRNFYTKIVK